MEISAQKTEGTDTWSYSWNAENELTKVEKNSAEIARYAYDPLGRRVEKIAGGITTTYAYDGEDVLREVRGSTTLKYVHGSGIDEPLGADDGAGPSFFHGDVLGSVVKATIELCISNRHQERKRGGRSEPVTKERRSEGRRRAFWLRLSSLAMSSSRLSGRPFARAALQWFQTRSSGLRSGA